MGVGARFKSSPILRWLIWEISLGGGGSSRGAAALSPSLTIQMYGSYRPYYSNMNP